jgi:hypothetical protein
MVKGGDQVATPGIVPHKHTMVPADYVQGCHDGLYSRLDPRDK